MSGPSISLLRQADECQPVPSWNKRGKATFHLAADVRCEFLFDLRPLQHRSGDPWRFV